MTDEAQDAAREYFNVGWNVMPLKASAKTPLDGGSWKLWQDDRQTQDEFDHVFAGVGSCNVGILTGRGSGLIVIDVDDPNAIPALESRVGKLESPLVAKTAKGWHYYYRRPGTLARCKTEAGLLPGLDVRGDGGYVVAPPSRHPTGESYRWLDGFSVDRVAELREPPAAMIAWLESRTTDAAVPPMRDTVIPTGERNATLTKMAGSVVRHAASLEEAVAILMASNLTQCVPPLDEAEVQRIVGSIWRRASKRGETRSFKVRTYDTIQERTFDWLWQGYIPLRELTALDGLPGVGKSTLASLIATRVTTGAPMPDGSPGCDGGVVIVGSEECTASVTVPRLRRMGANLARVADVVIGDDEGEFATLPVDLDRIEAAVQRVGARLLVVDPLMGALSGGVRATDDQEIRGALRQLLQLARSHDLAIVLIRHPTKKAELSALHAGAGSSGITAQIRSGLLLARDRKSQSTSVLAKYKANGAELGKGLAFEVGAGAITYVGPSEWTAEELHAASLSPAPPQKQSNAREFLEEVLGDGPRAVALVNLEARERGIARTTLERAREALGVRSYSSEGGQMLALPFDALDVARQETPQPAGG